MNSNAPTLENKGFFDPGEEHWDPDTFSGHPDSGAALPGVGVEHRGEGLAGCSGTQAEEQLFLEWEWSLKGRDWLAVQVH